MDFDEELPELLDLLELLELLKLPELFELLELLELPELLEELVLLESLDLLVLTRLVRPPPQAAKDKTIAPQISTAIARCNLFFIHEQPLFRILIFQ